MAAAARNTYVNEAVERDAFLAEIDGMSAISFTLVTGIMLDSFNGFGSNRAYYTALAQRSIDRAFNFFTQEVQNAPVLGGVRGLDFTDTSQFTLSIGAPFDPNARTFGSPDEYYNVSHLLIGHTCALLNSLDEDLRLFREFIDNNAYTPSMLLHQYSNAFVTAEYTRVLNEITSDTVQAAFTLPACNKKGLAFAMKVLNDVDFIDALRYAAVSYRTMLTGIWGSMITTMPQHWLDNLADQNYFTPALMPATRPVDKAALLNDMTNAPYVEADAHGLACASTVTGYYDPSDLVAITTPALTAAEISAISANNAPAPPAAPIVALFASIFEGHGGFKPWVVPEEPV